MRTPLYKRIVMFGVAVSAITALPAAANAQMIGPCPSFIMPPPCIIFDYKRLAENAKQYQQQYQHIQETIKQVEQAKQSVQSIGSDLTTVSTGPAPKIWQTGDVFTTVKAGDYNDVAQGFASTMFGGTKLTADQTSTLLQTRTRETIASNSDAIATAIAAKSGYASILERMDALKASTGTSTNLREDFIANSQIRLEIARQQQVKNQLMASLLQNLSVESGQRARADQNGIVSTSRKPATAALAPRNTGWDTLSQLRAKEAEIRSAYTMLAFASGVETVNEDLRAIVSRYENATATKNQTYATLQRKAYDWSSKSGARILSTTMSALANIDSQMAALRARPISELSGAFRERNLNVEELMAAGVDPRQFIGTFADPLKGEWTLKMANSLLDGPLDGPIDGEENDEYRVALMNFNNARLEEAWSQTHSIEAKALQAETAKMVKDEAATSGYDVGSYSEVEARLRKLIGEANTLAQQVQASGEPTATNQASAVMNSINGLLNGG